jgi:parvulin-like peptidyl-prolyl isomerase
MKLKSFLSAALVAGAMSVHAAAGGSNAVVKADAMTTLFGDPVVAKGKGFEIKRSELDGVVTGAKANAAAANQMLPADFEVSVLNQLITIQLLLQKAMPADREIGQKESDDQFQKLMKRFDSPEAFARQLKVVGMTEADLRSKATQEATAKAALKRELSLTVTDAQIQEAYSNHAAAFEEPERAHVRHILLMTVDSDTRMPLSTNVAAAKRKQIDDLLKRANGGEDFAKLASEFSEDPGSKKQGGELSAFGRGAMVPEFESAAFALKPNQISDVITTMYGYHIIKMIEKLPAKKYGLMETIPQVDKTPAALCKAELESEQIAKAAPAFIQKLRKDLNVEILDANLKALEQAALEAATNAPAGTNP